MSFLIFVISLECDWNLENKLFFNGQGLHILTTDQIYAYKNYIHNSSFTVHFTTHYSKLHMI